MTSSKALKFRLAQLSDLEAVVEIYNSTVASRLVTADLEPVSVESRIGWFQRHDAGHRPLWVVEEEGTVVGWLGFQPFHSRAAYAATAEISLYLAPQARGKGLGRAMLDFGLQRAASLGIATVIGLIFEHNVASTRLFEKAGFEEWGFLPKIANLDGERRGLKYFGKHL